MGCPSFGVDPPSPIKIGRFPNNSDHGVHDELDARLVVVQPALTACAKRLQLIPGRKVCCLSVNDCCT